MQVVLLNHSSVVSADDALRWAAAINAQLEEDVLPHWGFGATVRVGNDPRPDEWQIALLDDTDQANVLGYHSEDSTGKPIGFVFAKTVLDDGLEPSATISHEILETVANPFIDACALGIVQRTPQVVAYELCDPVEADTYTKRGVVVSDFVLPAFFDGRACPPCDFLGNLPGPFTLTSSGSLLVSDISGNWTSVGAERRPASRRLTEWSRRARYQFGARGLALRARIR